MVKVGDKVKVRPNAVGSATDYINKILVVASIAGHETIEAYINSDSGGTITLCRGNHSTHREEFDVIDEKKVIGYKAPYDMFNGTIKAGHRYQPLASVNPRTYCAMSISGQVPLDSGKTNLPAEIVETWEPIYEEFKAGDWVITISKADRIYNKPGIGEIFRVYKVWENDVYFAESNSVGSNRVRIATPEEIQEHLIKEAQQKGFTDGKLFVGLRDVEAGESWSDVHKAVNKRSKESAKCGGYFSYKIETDTLYTHGYGVFVVYEKGMWAASPKSDVTLVLGTNKVTINISSQKVTCRGKEIRMSALKALVAKLNESFGKATDEWNINLTDATFLVGCSSENNRFTLEEIKQVIEAHNKLQ